MKLSLRIDHESTTFSGRLTVKVYPEVNTYCSNEFNYVLFEQSEDLKILQSTAINDNPDSCVYVCPIEFKFPTSLNCACGDTCQLPSSLSVNNGKLRIKSTYMLSATVERSVIGKITRTNGVKQELPFSCNPIVNDLAASCTVALSADKLSQDFKDSSREIIGLICEVSPPTYSPSLQMEVILPESPVLTRGRGTPVRLVLHTPRELMQRANIYVRSVEIQLEADISALLRSTWQNMRDTRLGNTINGAVPIKSEHFELDLGAWGTFAVMQSRPSLNSCLLKIAYSLEVVAGISNGLEGSIQYLKASLDVLVMDPPPTYQAAADQIP
ncbi:hypothetical protein TrVGV298_002404 [Trichoderma virens]|nr:hypothetical protein TrVGV298_002404 [Trichoderma virens]